MPYFMRRLIVDELRLRNTFTIIREYLASFDSGEVSIPNFSHDNTGGGHAINLRALYSTNSVVTKAGGFLDQLVNNGDINEYRPSGNWEDRNNVPTLDREYCVLAFVCTSAISDLNEFENITENNLVDSRFPICFFHRLFNQLGIDLRFTQSDLQSYCTTDIQTMVNNSINALSDIDFNREDFYNPPFFKRFIHMFCNNLLVQPDILNANGHVVQAGGENKFFDLFYFKNAPRYFSLDDCIQRFCEELVSR